MWKNKRILVTGGSGFIGTHLLQKLIGARITAVLNVDLNRPKLNSYNDYWINCDILCIKELEKVFDEFKPTHVFHLAAKASLNGRSITDFPENTIGTRNVVQCVNTNEGIERFIHFSTQYVVRPGIWPETDEFLLPYTPYGASKAEAEKIVRNKCNKCWTILRPTNVWGPFHPFFPYELWKYLRLRFYLHPGFKPINKYYTYVENAIDQILAIASGDDGVVCNRVFYITDPPIDNAKWMDAFSVSLSGRPVRRIPTTIWKILARFGDCLNRFGMSFPMSSDRLFRLTVNEQVPIQPIIDLAGGPKISLEEGVQRSVRWYETVREEDKQRSCHV